ncbi:early nodulin-like protein 6 [Lolium perenne]|uniref:early nodulin-like protein 6 n=1 Tax=Lolium perenne TaxID=4522 RepID=UPI0021EA724A|nr:early nodulin-like protein 1 [Lolium perenne]
MANRPMITLGVLLALIGASCAADFEVGGDAGWVVPPAGQAGTYNEWASKNRFLLGDSVHFKYKKDSVMVVTEEEYDKCASTHPIFFSNNGDTEVRLDHAGLFYFISGVTGHCERGQKMAVKVIGPDAPPPAPPSPPHPSGAAPAVAFAGALAAVAATLLPVVLRGV